MACSTSRAVPGLTVRVRFTTCETVDTETPARRATSTIVATAFLGPDHTGIAPDRQAGRRATTASGNYHRADPPTSAPVAVAGLPRLSNARLVGLLHRSIEAFTQAFFSGDFMPTRRGRSGAFRRSPDRATEFLFLRPPIYAGIVFPAGLFNILTEGRRRDG